MSVVFALLRVLWPFLLLGGAYLWADNGWHNNVAQRAEKRALAAETKLAALDKLRIERQERAAQVAAFEELKARKQDAERAKRFAAARNRVPSTDSRVPLSDGTRRMLGDAYAAAVAAEAPEATSAADSGAPTIADWQKWSVDILEWAAMARDRVQAWERWYQLNSGESYEQIF